MSRLKSLNTLSCFLFFIQRCDGREVSSWQFSWYYVIYKIKNYTLTISLGIFPGICTCKRSNLGDLKNVLKWTKSFIFAATNRFKSMFLEQLLICCFSDPPGIKAAGLLIRPIHRHGQLVLLTLFTRMEQWTDHLTKVRTYPLQPCANNSVCVYKSGTFNRLPDKCELHRSGQTLFGITVLIHGSKNMYVLLNNKLIHLDSYFKN